MQDFAKARRDHEQFYSVDWKYIAKERQLPPWPETREDMQARQERALEHILEFYTGAAAKDKDSDLSIVLVTHASPVNGRTRLETLCCWWNVNGPWTQKCLTRLLCLFRGPILHSQLCWKHVCRRPC